MQTAFCIIGKMQKIPRMARGYTLQSIFINFNFSVFCRAAYKAGCTDVDKSVAAFAVKLIDTLNVHMSCQNKLNAVIRKE